MRIAAVRQAPQASLVATSAVGGDLTTRKRIQQLLAESGQTLELANDGAVATG